MEQIIEQFFYNYFIVYIEKFWVMLSIAISLYKMIIVIANRIKNNKEIVGLKSYVISIFSILIYHIIHYNIFYNLDVWYIVAVLSMNISIIIYQCIQKNQHMYFPSLIGSICVMYMILGIITNNVILFLCFDVLILLPTIIRQIFAIFNR